MRALFAGGPQQIVWRPEFAIVAQGRTITARALNATVAPGQESAIWANMDSRRFLGHKAVTIYVSFDQPRYEEIRLVVQAYSREANDIAQCLFALYVSVAILCATRGGAHLATDAMVESFAELRSVSGYSTTLIEVPTAMARATAAR